MKFTLKLIAAFLSKFKLIIFLSVLVGLLIFLILGKLLPYISTQSTERIGLTGRYRPESLPDFILQMISSGLTFVSEDERPIADIASSWETTDKGKTWIFHLRDNVFWQDGEKVTSDSIKYEFSDVQVEAKDAKTLVFTLKDPFIPFPSVVSKPVFRKGLLGTGEWKVKKLKLNGWYVEELLLTSKDNKKILFRFYPTIDSTKIAFKLGHVDKLINVLEPDPFTVWKGLRINKTVNVNQAVTIFFNTQDKLFGDKSFRQALTYAIDKKSLGERALGPIAPNSWAYNPQEKEYAYDVNRAKEIIKALPDELKKDMQVKLVTTPILLNQAEIIANDWKAVGVDTLVQVSSVVPSEFQAFLTILDIPSDPDQYPLWHSTQTTSNISNYGNPRIDKLLEDGRSEENFENRKKIYFDFQRFLMEDIPAAFLYHPLYYEIGR